MPTYKDLFNDEVCQCGGKGDYILSNGSGQVRGFQCKNCYEKEAANTKKELPKTIK